MTTLLREIASEKTRNLLRGVLASNGAHRWERPMERLRQTCTPSDALTVYRFLRDSQTAAHIPSTPPFPTEISTDRRLPIFREAPIGVQLAATKVRLENNIAELAEAIDLVRDLNMYIFDRNVDGMARSLKTYREMFGLSLNVMAKAVSLRHSTVQHSTVRQATIDSLAPFLTPRRQLVTVALENTVDKEFDYLRARRSLLRFVEENRFPVHLAPIIQDYLSPFRSPPYSDQKLQAYRYWSALDLLGYTLGLIRRLQSAGDADSAAEVERAVPSELIQKWTSAFQGLDVTILSHLVTDEPNFVELRLLAHSPAWNEYPEVFDYRSRVEGAIGARLDGVFPVPRHVAASFADPVTNASALLAQHPLRLSLSRADPKSSGFLHRTIALLASLERGTLKVENGEVLRDLLDQTSDVSALLSIDELHRFLPKRRDDGLYEYLRTALLSEADPGRVTNHAFRRSLQKILAEGFDSDILKFVTFLDRGTGHVADHLYYVCTEYFLTELYEIYKEADEVIEAHAQLLEWHGTSRDNEDEVLLARSYRLNLLLNKVRGSIEETRIYVDPLRFIQWVQDELAGDLRNLVESAEQIEIRAETHVPLIDPVRALQEPRMRLLQVIEKAYREFCTNKFNGIDSYVGRRIRHGTLHGRLVAELRPAVEQTVSESITIHPQFARYLERWFADYEAAVQELASEVLHVRSKDRQHGVIYPTVEDADKRPALDRAMSEIIRVMRERRPTAVSIGLIHEYCWVLFEADLRRCRDAVEALRRRYVINPAEHCLTDAPELDHLLTRLIRQLNSDVLHQFEIVRAWLTRPGSISPTANVTLLFQAVLREVSDRYPDFSPRVLYEGDADINLIGHRFHFFYDALYILVDNAAKHGRRSGTLGLQVRSVGADSATTTFEVSISSELEPTQSEASEKSIHEAMSKDVGDAMTKETGTGLRKVRGLVEDVEEMTGFRYQLHDEMVTFTIVMSLPKS